MSLLYEHIKYLKNFPSQTQYFLFGKINYSLKGLEFSLYRNHYLLHHQALQLWEEFIVV